LAHGEIGDAQAIDGEFVNVNRFETRTAHEESPDHESTDGERPDCH
jgi:hypothetical protein